jgi:hypothetical protein
LRIKRWCFLSISKEEETVNVAAKELNSFAGQMQPTSSISAKPSPSAAPAVLKEDSPNSRVYHEQKFLDNRSGDPRLDR